MIRFVRIPTDMQGGVSYASARFDAVRRQPNFIVRWATITFALILLVPFVLLVVLAVLAASVVFGILSLGWTIWRLVSQPLAGRRDGRSNVRVLQRRADDPGRP